MKIYCASDLHGILPTQTEEHLSCDLAVIAGDICPDWTWMNQLGFIKGPFKDWISRFKQAIFVAGNHDIIIDDAPNIFRSVLDEFPANVVYLEDDAIRFPNLHIWGTPWTPTYKRPCFMGNESLLREKFSRIPRELDILITHGPPRGYGDPGRDEEHAGSIAMLDVIYSKQPKLVVCGHLHEGYGIYQIDRTTLVNAALHGIKRGDGLIHQPILIDL